MSPAADAATWEFYDEYVAFPHSASSRDDERVGAVLRCARRNGDHTEPFTVTWTRIGRDGDAIVSVHAYTDGAVALADSGVCALVAELEARHGRPLAVEDVTAALVAGGWSDRTDELRSPVHHCPTCSHDGYDGPHDIVAWRRRTRRS